MVRGVGVAGLGHRLFGGGVLGARALEIGGGRLRLRDADGDDARKDDDDGDNSARTHG
jgi:hypothetical protein